MRESKLKMLPYQVESFKDRSRFKVLMWSRGARKTFTVTLEIVSECFRIEARGQRTTWIILSRGERQAKAAIDEAKRHCNAYLMMSSEIIESEFISEDGLRRFTQMEIRFPNGSKIIALPANPDTARGYTANVFLDEFCIHERDTEIWRSLLPVLRGRFRVIVASTPKGGVTRKFYQIINDETLNKETGKFLWSKHIVDVYEAVRQGLPFDIETERSAMSDPEGWAQEFELQWITEASAWLTMDTITACEDDRAGLGVIQGRGEFYFGNDIARRGDLWVLWVLERVGDVLWTREVSTLTHARFSEHEAEVDRLFKKYKPVRMCLDQTGMGEPILEAYEDRYGSCVEGVIFGNTTKYGLATTGKKAFEDRSLRIPPDPKYRADFYKLKRTETAAGNIRFDAVRDSTGHCDYTWACFLAINAASTGAPASLNARTSGTKRLKSLAGF